MKYSRIAVIVGVFSFIVASLNVSGAEQPQVWSSFKTSVMSEYLGSIGSIFYDQPVSVNEVTVGYKDIYVDIWSSTGLGGKKYGQTYGDEFDFTLGWVKKFSSVKVEISASYFAVAMLDQSRDDIWIAESEISFPGCPFVEPYIRGRYFGEVSSSSPRPGFFWYGGLRKGIPLGKVMFGKESTLNLQLSTAFAGGGLHDTSGFVYGRLSTSLDVHLSKVWTVSPSFIYQVAMPGQRNDPYGFTKANAVVYGLTLGCRF